VTIIVRGSNKLVLEEAERSLHDALCVSRCLVRDSRVLPGGGAPEIRMSIGLEALSRTITGVDSYCFKAYANALEVSSPFLFVI
jgi:T-complex protein 1 subunit delta